jgi:serine/threonine protein kinase
MSSSEEHTPDDEPEAAGSARLATPSPTPVASEDLTGTCLASRYQLEQLLGEGPIGRVYRARITASGTAHAQNADDQRLVVIKVLQPRHRADANVVRRFLRAGETTRGFDHPHIVRTLDHGTDQGIPFICSELAAGAPLNRALADTPLTLRHVLTPIRDVLSALAEAHRQGVVHRCLKPSNVLVELRPDDSLVTKLCDFDLGRLLKPVPGTGRTKRGASCGMAEYMAPEQALTTEIDGRADLYAVGVMLYELLTGQPPFTGPRSEDILAQHQNDAVVPPRTLRKDRTIPREVESICLRALAKQPGDRYQSAREMSGAIRATLELFGARADLPIEEPEVVLDDSAHTVSKDRLTMPGEQLRSNQKVGIGAALLVSVCGMIWLSAPRETGDQKTGTKSGQPAIAPAASSADGLSKARTLLDTGQALMALKELEAARATQGESPALDRLLGEALLKVGQRERGRALLERYLSENPSAQDRVAVDALLAEP